jgi:hypothetical protein
METNYASPLNDNVDFPISSFKTSGLCVVPLCELCAVLARLT